MRSAVIAATVCVAFLTNARPVRAQPSAATASTAVSQPTFRTGTTLVEVAAVVTDRQDRPVTDLARSEVTVLDNGKPQQLTLFERVDLTTVTGPAQRRDFLFVVDDLHIAPARSAAVQDVVQTLIGMAGPDDRLALFTTGPFAVQIDLSTEHAPLRAAARRVLGQRPSGAPMPGELALRARQAMSVLRQLATSVRSGASERRSIVLISEGHAMRTESSAFSDDRGAFQEYLEILREAALSNVSIYAINPVGLQVGGADASVSSAAASGVSRVPMSGRFGSLALLADNTGGLLTVDNNDLLADVPRLFSDSVSTIGSPTCSLT